MLQHELEFGETLRVEDEGEFSFFAYSKKIDTPENSIVLFCTWLTDVIQLSLTLKMITAQVVETSVTVNNNSPINDYVHPDDRTQPTFINALCDM